MINGELELLPIAKAISENLTTEHAMERRKAWDDLKAFTHQHGADTWNRLLDHLMQEEAAAIRSLGEKE